MRAADDAAEPWILPHMDNQPNDAQRPMSIEQRPLTPWRTSSGVVVGGAYRRPPQQMTAEAERVQGLLLGAGPQDDDAGHRAVLWVSCVGTVAVVVALWAGWL